MPVHCRAGLGYTMCLHVLNMCLHAIIYVSARYYICARMLLYLCRHATIFESGWYYMCPHATIYVPACFRMLLYTCPHMHRRARIARYLSAGAATRIFVSSCYYTCRTSAEALLLQSVCSHAAIYVCPHVTIYVCAYTGARGR